LQEGLNVRLVAAEADESPPVGWVAQTPSLAGRIKQEGSLLLADKRDASIARNGGDTAFRLDG
jgi:hypothetical protein